MNNFSKTIFLLFITVLVMAGLFYADSARAVCTLQSVSWSKQTVGVGENVNITVGATAAAGQDCLGRTIQLDIKEKDTLFNDFIRTIIVVFEKNAFSAVRSFAFTRADFDAGDEIGEGSEEEMYIEATVTGGNTVSNRDTGAGNPVLMLLRPTSDSCLLGSARWAQDFGDAVIIGSELHMVVNASQCAGIPVNFTIRSDDFGPDIIFGNLSQTFDSTGTRIDVIWTINADRDNRIITSRVGFYDFYFIAEAGPSSTESNRIRVPPNSQNGCISCNNIPGVPFTSFDCSDGTTVGGGTQTFGIAQACINNIGDSLGDTGSGSGTCNNNGTCDAGEISATCSDCPVTPGTSVPFDFEIKNPLQANSLIELINVIATWLLNIAIPIAVAMIVYSGVIFLMSQGEPTKLSQAKKILLYAVVGLSIILIGKGFITLIESILNLGVGP